jgi:hypothetical protein
MINRTLKREVKKEKKANILQAREMQKLLYWSWTWVQEKKKNPREIRAAEMKFVRNQEMYQVRQL